MRPTDLNQLLLPSFDPKAPRDVLAKGLPASPGAAVGKLAFTADEAVERTERGEKVLLIRKETSPEDVAGMHSAAGILTSTGGMTSHAAVVARGWGKCCVAGASDVKINEKSGTITIDGRKFTRNDTISIDGTKGEVMAGAVATQAPKLSGDFSKVMKWATSSASLMSAPMPTPRQTPSGPASSVPRASASAVPSTCSSRTTRIMAMREMILADNEEDRKKALKKLLPVQRKDFIGIFTAMKGLPVTVRLLDPPLHEFLPHDDKSQAEMAGRLNVKRAEVKSRVDSLHEMNPMLGHRGCRLAVTYPEILAMQVTAITEAVIECKEQERSLCLSRNHDTARRHRRRVKDAQVR